MNIPLINLSFGENTVLIDTWWNVNFIRKSANYKNGNGFNRYMVECELRNKVVYNPPYHSFNRYMVECEFSRVVMD